jgi:hypothetical protein
MSAQLDAEERAMEAEALEAIFMESYSGDGATYRLELEPESDEAHVACVLECSCPETYPSSDPPSFSIADVRGLGGPMRKELEASLAEAVQLFEPGCVCVFEVASAVKDWLGEHNEPGLNDESAYAAMMRREKGGKEKKAVVYETDSNRPESEEARKQRLEEEAEARRLERLRLGTAVTPESFAAWWEPFRVDVLKEPKEGVVETVYLDVKGAVKLTGKQQFLKGKAPAAVEDAPGVDEELFDDDDDLDDLDFDDEEEEDT